MKQIFHRLYLSILFISFAGTAFGTYQIYEKFKTVFENRQQIELKINKINNQISTFSNPDAFEKEFLKQLQVSRDCYQDLVQKWEYSNECEENQPVYFYDNLKYNFDSYIIFLVLIMFIPLWIILIKKWVTWIANGKT